MAALDAESTRVFVTGLPKSLTSDQLAAHFSKQYNVTDAHVLPNRHMGFVGFNDHDTAQHAVKHFNRSYIRMSKIVVDLARPIEVSRGVHGQATPVSQRQDRRKTKELGVKKPAISDDATSNGEKKRKRDIQDDGEEARGESGSKQTHLNAVSNQDSLLPQPTIDTEKSDEDAAKPQSTSDNDWLREKTSRLLDLQTPDEMAQEELVHGEQNSAPVSENQAETEESSHEDNVPSRTRPIVPNGRLFVRNIAFSVKEDDLEQRFGKFGKIQEVHVVLDNRTASSKGMAYIQFSEHADAANALEALDGVAFHGRLLHVLPASDKRENGLTEFDLSKMPLKKQKALRRKFEASSAAFSWNSLYMNPDAVIGSIASRLGVSKSDVLDPTSADAAVKQAHAETQIIAETKEYLRSHGIQIDAFRTKARDDRAILLKNFPFGTSENELRALLEPHGDITRFIMPTTGTMAIVAFAEPYLATQALKGLAYKNIKGSVLYLERAPQGLFANELEQQRGVDSKSLSENVSSAESSGLDRTGPIATVFIRNLSFNTSSRKLEELLSPLGGFLSAKVKTRVDPRRSGEILSMGFGFAEFKSTADADAAIAAVNGYRLDGHELIVQLSTKSTDMAEERRQADNLKKSDANKTKIIIKNLPFQASKKDIRSLFSQYGQLKNVRLPKKFDNTSRGFAFAEFVTAKEAAHAMDSLANTHLLGRRLVLDFVGEETTDAEEQIKATEKKIEQQNNRINISKLMGTGRKKFTIGSAEDEAL